MANVGFMAENIASGFVVFSLAATETNCGVSGTSGWFQQCLDWIQVQAQVMLLLWEQELEFDESSWHSWTSEHLPANCLALIVWGQQWCQWPTSMLFLGSLDGSSAC